MSPQVSAIMLGVKDLARAKRFYAEGLGCTIDKDTRNFVSFSLGEGSPQLALYEWHRGGELSVFLSPPSASAGAGGGGVVAGPNRRAGHAGRR